MNVKMGSKTARKLAKINVKNLFKNPVFLKLN